MRRRHLTAAAALCMLLCAAASPAQVPVTIVVPGAQATTDGGADNQFPFNPRSVGTSTIRYQQVYSASEFAPGRYLISQLAFRTDPQDPNFPVPPFSGTTGTLRIDLSTTSASPDGLSTTFANNLGPDNTTVFTGQWALSTANNGAFDMILDLTTPFLYDPSRGNLLMDVRNFGGGSIDVLNNFFVTFDAQITVGDSVSRVYTGQSGDGVNLTDGIPDPLRSLGLVTRFAAAFVPSQTPAQQTQALIDRVNALVTGGVLNKGQANGLTQPLQNALRSLLINKLAPACSQLSDFQQGVNGLVNQGLLPVQEGTALFNAAAVIQAALGC